MQDAMIAMVKGYTVQSYKGKIVLSIDFDPKTKEFVLWMEDKTEVRLPNLDLERVTPSWLQRRYNREIKSYKLERFP